MSRADGWPLAGTHFLVIHGRSAIISATLRLSSGGSQPCVIDVITLCREREPFMAADLFIKTGFSILLDAEILRAELNWERSRDLFNDQWVVVSPRPLRKLFFFYGAGKRNEMCDVNSTREEVFDWYLLSFIAPSKFSLSLSLSLNFVICNYIGGQESCILFSPLCS